MCRCAMGYRFSIPTESFLNITRTLNELLFHVACYAPATAGLQRVGCEQSVMLCVHCGRVQSHRQTGQLPPLSLFRTCPEYEVDSLQGVCDVGKEGKKRVEGGASIAGSGARIEATTMLATYVWWASSTCMARSYGPLACRSCLSRCSVSPCLLSFSCHLLFSPAPSSHHSQQTHTYRYTSTATHQVYVNLNNSNNTLNISISSNNSTTSQQHQP